MSEHKILARNLVALEVAMYSGKFRDEFSEVEVALIYNFFIAERMAANPIPFRPEDMPALFEKAQFEGFEVPRFVEIVNNLMGGEFFRKVWKASYPDATFELYLISFIYDGMKRLANEPISLPHYLQNWLFERASSIVQGNEVAVPKLLAALLWFDKSIGAESEEHSLGWFYLWILPRFRNVTLPSWLSDVFDLPSQRSKDSKELGYSRFIEALALNNGELKPGVLAGNIHDIRKAMSWFCRWKAPALNDFQYSDWQMRALSEPALPGAASVGVCRFAEYILHASPDLQRRYDLNSTTGQESFFAWFVTEFYSRHFKFEIPAWVREKAAERNLTWAYLRSGLRKSTLETVTGELAVNLIGWPKTEIGIGEDIRVAADALQLQQVPFVIIDAAKRLPPVPKQVELGYAKHTVEEPVNQIDLVYLDASTQYRYYAFDAVKGNVVNRRVVGVCPWELSRWPEEGIFALTSMDYFFASSKYIYDAFSPYFPRERIFHVRPAVQISDDDLRPRAPNKTGPFRFLTTFDGLSSVYRKNPVATVRAFQLAFPRENRDVALVVKMMNASPEHEVIRELHELIAADSRISVVSETLTRTGLFDLVHSADCFVSLHRSEGLGRNIAESMLLGKPVIVSAYSGNLDFCDANTSYLVSGSEVGVNSWEYSFSKDQVWFDASVEDAAQQMKRVFQNTSEAKEIAERGRVLIETEYSVLAAGIRYVNALTEISKL